MSPLCDHEEEMIEPGPVDGIVTPLGMENDIPEVHGRGIAVPTTAPIIPAIASRRFMLSPRNYPTWLR